MGVQQLEPEIRHVHRDVLSHDLRPHRQQECVIVTTSQVQAGPNGSLTCLTFQPCEIQSCGRKRLKVRPLGQPMREYMDQRDRLVPPLLVERHAVPRPIRNTVELRDITLVKFRGRSYLVTQQI